jgi:phosphomannomutase
MGSCVRNHSPTHLLDRVALDFGQECHEVPVGFKYVSAKMARTGAILGGESSGGLAVRGHIPGKDGIYAAALLVEMLAVTGKSIAEIYREIIEEYGMLFYEEASFSTTPEHKQQLKQLVFHQKQLPVFCGNAERISYEDGCKVVFSDGSWVICRFSGTEPLLRIAAEGTTREQAAQLISQWKDFLKL